MKERCYHCDELTSWRDLATCRECRDLVCRDYCTAVGTWDYDEDGTYCLCSSCDQEEYYEEPDEPLEDDTTDVDFG